MSDFYTIFKKGVGDNFKLKAQTFHIDNNVFKLHYRVTTVALIVATILVTSRQYIGEHIKCIAGNGVPENVINTFCFFTTTFTVMSHVDDERVRNRFVAHPGVGHYGLNSTEAIVRHAYYQWVPFFLFGQALLFMLPHLIWKHIEGGRLKRLLHGLVNAHFAFAEKEIKVKDQTIPTKQMRMDAMATIRKAFLDNNYISTTWPIGLICCEILNLLNVILQIFATDRFLGGKFISLGSHVMNEGFESQADILDEVFPKVTKCNFHKYGPGGTIQTHDALCIMALNVINEKIYVFLWFWFLILFIFSVLGLVWRFTTMIIHAKSDRFNYLIFSTSLPSRLNPWSDLTPDHQFHNFQYKDWIFLKYLAKNMDPLVFKEFLMSLAYDLYMPLMDLQ